MKQHLGFTIVEVAIVITVIAILSTVSAVSYSAMQVRARDTERQADVDSMKAALETYYEQKGEYPALISSELGAVPTFYTDTLRLSNAVLVAPSAASGTTFSWIWANSVTSSTQYGLMTYHSDGTQCIDTAPCTRYTMSWLKEADNSTQTVLSKFGN